MITRKTHFINNMLYFIFHTVTNQVRFKIGMILKMIILEVPFLCLGKYLNSLAMWLNFISIAAANCSPFSASQWPSDTSPSCLDLCFTSSICSQRGRATLKIRDTKSKQKIPSHSLEVTARRNRGVLPPSFVKTSSAKATRGVKAGGSGAPDLPHCVSGRPCSQKVKVLTFSLHVCVFQYISLWHELYSAFPGFMCRVLELWTLWGLPFISYIKNVERASGPPCWTRGPHSDAAGVRLLQASLATPPPYLTADSLGLWESAEIFHSLQQCYLKFPIKNHKGKSTHL